MNVALIILIAALAAGCAVVAWYLQSQRTRHFRERFGPEYDRIRSSAPNARAAEAELASREKRVEKFNIRPLTPEERTRSTEVWGHVQTLFVDDPKGAIAEGDRLVNDVMLARGYPVAAFEQRASDISVDHPLVVEHYRAARAIADRQAKGNASTEDLRQAVIHYRALFEDLLDLKRSDVAQAGARR
jgi:hypothetical protein